MIFMGEVGNHNAKAEYGSSLTVQDLSLVKLPRNPAENLQRRVVARDIPVNPTAIIDQFSYPASQQRCSSFWISRRMAISCGTFMETKAVYNLLSTCHQMCTWRRGNLLACATFVPSRTDIEVNSLTEEVLESV
jgi:hypothetical protein